MSFEEALTHSRVAYERGLAGRSLIDPRALGSYSLGDRHRREFPPRTDGPRPAHKLVGRRVSDEVRARMSASALRVHAERRAKQGPVVVTAKAYRMPAGVRAKIGATNRQRKEARPSGITSLPGFVESLRVLVAREEYSLTDIAPMFGVSRERIRQIVGREQIPVHEYSKGSHARRVWDDVAHRFRPVSKRATAEAAERTRVESRAAIVERVRNAYRLHIETAVAALAAREAGRLTRVSDVYEAIWGRSTTVTGASPALIGALHLRSANRPTAPTLREWLAKRGINIQRPGKGRRVPTP